MYYKQRFCLIINAKFFVLIKLDRNFILVSVEFMSSWSLLSGFSQLLSSYFGSFTLGKKLNEEDMQRTRLLRKYKQYICCLYFHKKKNF